MKKFQALGSVVVTALLFTALAGCSPATDSAGDGVNNATKGSQQMKPKVGGMMEPKTAPELTAAQSQELQAGAAAHKPKTLTFNVVGGNFYFTPSIIHVKKGDTVKIIFKNAGGMHNWVLDEFKVAMEPILAQETATVEFVADKSGSFEYYCSVSQHRQMGMKGTLVVE